MANGKERPERLEKLDDLKPLLTSAGPCFSVYMTLSNASTAGRNPNAKQNELRWRECLQSVEQRVSSEGGTATELLASLRSWFAGAPETNGEGRRGHAKSIAVFRSPDVFQVAELDAEVAERAVFGRQFYIRPVVKEYVRARSFYLLGLSRRNTRLLHCTMNSSEEIAFPDGFKTDYEAWMDLAKPDHRAIDNAMAAPAGGSARPSALATKSTIEEDKDEYLRHFVKHIADGVGQALKGKTEELVLCAVDYEIPIYREVNTYPHLAVEPVYGAPNGLKSGEMHARAIDALHRCYDRKVDDALAEWNHKVGGGASSHLKEVVTAAHNGRVLMLLASDSQEQNGVFDEASNSVHIHGTEPSEELVNDAVVQTMLHSGKVLVVEQKKMPNGVAVAATYRF